MAPIVVMSIFLISSLLDTGRPVITHYGRLSGRSGAASVYPDGQYLVRPMGKRVRKTSPVARNYAEFTWADHAPVQVGFQFVLDA